MQRSLIAAHHQGTPHWAISNARRSTYQFNTL